MANLILDAAERQRRKIVWDGLFNKKPFGRIAINNAPGNSPLPEKIIPDIPKSEDITLTGPVGEKPLWDEIIRGEIRGLYLLARSRYQDDSFPALDIPRNIHGQSQAMAEAFGCRLIPQGAENENLLFPIPSIQSPADVDRLKVKPIEDCLYGEAIKFAQYACEVTNGDFSFRNPVMTGPLDTVNYVLGTTRLLNWVYAEPEALKRILTSVTDFLIDVIQKFQQATNGQFCPDECACLDRGFGLCSEVRSLISAETYEEFEAPYLLQIGKACGPYMIHSCGSWERTIPSLLQNPYIVLIDFGCREMDLRKVCALTQGKLSLQVHQSVNLDERFTWPDSASFFRHVMSEINEPLPLVIRFNSVDFDTYLSVQSEFKSGISRFGATFQY